MGLCLKEPLQISVGESKKKIASKTTTEAFRMCIGGDIYYTFVVYFGAQKTC